MFSFYCSFPLVNMKYNGMLRQVFQRGITLLQHSLCNNIVLQCITCKRRGNLVPYDNSGSSDLKCVVYSFVKLSISFVFGSFLM